MCRQAQKEKVGSRRHLLEATFASDLALPRNSLGKPTREVRANKTLRLQALVLPGFWAFMTAESALNRLERLW
jgi:hypothetical protein